MVTNIMTPKKNVNNDVTSTHAEYDKHINKIKLVNDIHEGIDTAKEYIFKFPQEIEETYSIRKERATLRNFVKRSTDAFTGMIFRKPIEINNYGQLVESRLATIDTKTSIELFSRSLAESAILDGKSYILVDSSADGKTAPYFSLIRRHEITNWRKDGNGNYTMVVLKEVVEVPNGLFGTNYNEQYRVYSIDTESEKVVLTIYKKSEGKTMGDGFYPETPIKLDVYQIPLFEVHVSEVPMLYDIAKMNIKHLNRQSHKDRYLTMAALPIPVIWGAEVAADGSMSTAKPAMVIGVDEAFMFTGTKAEADFEWRELKGDSVDLLEKDLESIVEDITTGVIRAADSSSAVQKTATEVQLLQAEASNRVTYIASNLEITIKDAILMLAYMFKESVPDGATFSINKDFNSTLMGSDGARVVFEQYLLGLLSTETFLQTMADMELINIGSAVDEIDRITNDNFRPQPRIENTNDIKTDNRTKNAMGGDK